MKLKQTTTQATHPISSQDFPDSRSQKHCQMPTKQRTMHPIQKTSNFPRVWSRSPASPDPATLTPRHHSYHANLGQVQHANHQQHQY